jgi:hypothetical protein
MSGDLIDVLHKIVQETMNGMKPADLVFGTVVTPSPISITLETTMQPIPEPAIVLTSEVIARSETVTATDSNGDRVTVTVPIVRPLQAGERVIMLRCSAGQRFVVLSRAQ